MGMGIKSYGMDSKSSISRQTMIWMFLILIIRRSFVRSLTHILMKSHHAQAIRGSHFQTENHSTRHDPHNQPAQGEQSKTQGVSAELQPQMDAS